MGIWVVELFSKARLDVFVVALPKPPNGVVELAVGVPLGFGVMWRLIQVLGIIVVSKGLLFTSLLGELRHVEVISGKWGFFQGFGMMVVSKGLLVVQGERMNFGLTSWR
jgi:hypothetical protein